MLTPHESPLHRRPQTRRSSENGSPFPPYTMTSPSMSSIQSINSSMKSPSDKSLSALNTHSHFVTTRSNFVNLIASLLYIVFNVVHHYSNEHFGSITFVWLSDCGMSILNGLMLVAAMCYWVSYVERAKFDAEITRIRNQQSHSQHFVNQPIVSPINSPIIDKLHEGILSENVVDAVDPESEHLIQQQLHGNDDDQLYLPHIHSHNASSAYSNKPQFYMAFVVYFLSFIPRQFGISLSHMMRTIHISLFVSPRLYIPTALGIAELLNMFGSLVFYVSSFFPVITSGHQLFLGGMRESIEAKLDEISYILDAIAMVAFVVSALFYIYSWKRHFTYRQPVLSRSRIGFLLDPEFWANVWNFGGGICYALSILYGLAIRIQIAHEEKHTWDIALDDRDLVGQSFDTESLLFQAMSTSVNISDVLFNETLSAVNASMNSLNDTPMSLADAQAIDGLSPWQRALFGLTLEQKGMMVLGDIMYAVCALVTQFADPSSSMRGGASRSRRTSVRAAIRHSDDGHSDDAHQHEPLMHQPVDMASDSITSISLASLKI